MLAALTTLEQAVGRSSNAREKAAVRRPPSAQPFIHVLAREQSLESRVAVGLASCATLPGPDRARMPARTMRQILLPMDPPEPVNQARTGGRWRDTPLIPGLGVRPLGDVLADVLAWRSRTAADEQGQQEFRGVPTFRSGVPVPAADLHAFAREQFDAADMNLWLLACLALDWRGVRCRWQADDDVFPVPALGLLHPLALGLATRGAEGDARRAALRPDWANRLAAGQVCTVHQEAVARYRQSGWDAVPPLQAAAAAGGVADGALLAAALVPRCRGKDAEALLRMLAVPLRDEREDDEQQEVAVGPSAAPGSAVSESLTSAAAR